MNNRCPSALIILDGWGYSTEHHYNAIFNAHPTTFTVLFKTYPHALLKASGTAVGLPEGAPGNSEVGHTTIGAGTILLEPLTIINNAINNDSFLNNQHLIDLLNTCLKKNGRLHLIGMLSEGTVHSAAHHLYTLIHAAVNHKIPHIFIHVILDGRDVPPQSAANYLHQLETVIAQYAHSGSTITIASLSGRFYAMDRDNNWQRTDAVYAILTHHKQDPHTVWSHVLEQNYQNHIFDEYIPPTLLDPYAILHNNDTIFFFNIRPDRMRQLVHLFVKTQNSHRWNLCSMVPYEEHPSVPFLYKKELPKNTLLDVLEDHKLSIFTCAETEKYAHVTYFFSGGKEAQRHHETRVLIHSHTSTDSYSSDPCMSAPEITDAVVHSLQKKPCAFYLINYANADMVGHSGNFESAVKAIKCLDDQLKILYKEFVEQRNGTLYITADHGNAEEMWDAVNNCPKKSHTANLVPFIYVQKKYQGQSIKLPLHQLSDIKNFILKNMKL